MSRAPRPRRRRTRLLVLTVAVAVAAALVATLVDGGATVLAVPGDGEVRPTRLRDGTPVLVAGTGEDSPVVLDARVPLAPGWTGVAGWCARRAVLLERLSARRWSRDGSAQLPAGPGRAITRSGEVAPPLARYEVDLAGDRLRVGARREPDPDQPVVESRQFRLCRPEAVEVPPLPGERVAFTQLHDADDGWWQVEAVMDLDAAPPRLCPPPGDVGCGGRRLPPLPETAVRPPGRAFAGTVAVRLRDGAVERVLVPADVEGVR